MGIKMYKHFSFLGPPKFTKIGMFGLKIYHLATLEDTTRSRRQGLSMVLCESINLFIPHEAFALLQGRFSLLLRCKARVRDPVNLEKRFSRFIFRRDEPRAIECT
jgi:hypothetical protein